ncbi:interferon alpha/beta receptor 1 isoform X2 [Parus major]|nr:interferon alpha/beta receptor 1 isoform X2 [Parus major]
MWINDLSFKYNLVFWENSSHAQLQSKTIFPVDTIDDLAPDSSYCFKVQANLPREGKQGLFSPISCVKTTQKVNDSLCATNLSIVALNMNFHLLWSTQDRQEVNYNVQYLHGFLKGLNDDHSDKWLSVPRCENITRTWCNFSSIITNMGFYYLRVEARRDSKSCLSRELKLDPLQMNGIGPPGLRLDLSDASLHILISPPGGAEDEAMRDFYDLSYRILYWKKSSEGDVKQKEVKQTIATVPDVSPSTLYCVKVQAFSVPYNKSSAYSQQECIHTPAGSHLPLIIFGIFMGALLVVLLVASPLVFVLYKAYNKIKYVFFPSCQPPLNIEVSSDFSAIKQLLCRKMNFKYHGKKKMFMFYGSARVPFRGFISGLQTFVPSPAWHSWCLAGILFWNEKGNIHVLKHLYPDFLFILVWPPQALMDEMLQFFGD